MRQTLQMSDFVLNAQIPDKRYITQGHTVSNKQNQNQNPNWLIPKLFPVYYTRFKDKYVGAEMLSVISTLAWEVVEPRGSLTLSRVWVRHTQTQYMYSTPRAGYG